MVKRRRCATIHGHDRDGATDAGGRGSRDAGTPWRRVFQTGEGEP
jgi:hypothetical protein